MGLICPHDGGFAIKLTEKVEDLITVLFLPLYFALSGLNTNLGLLNDGITWGYVVAIIAVAFAGKIVGGTFAAKGMGLVWRESLTIGVLMSCKGLVELIVLVSHCFLSIFAPNLICHLEHRLGSQNPDTEDLHHVCRDGSRHDVRNDSHCEGTLPALVPEED